MGGDGMLARIAAFDKARGGVCARKVARGYTLLSRRTGAPVARRWPTGDGDKVQVLWWNGRRWGASGSFGVVTMTLDCAPDYIANQAHSGSTPEPTLPKTTKA